MYDLVPILVPFIPVPPLVPGQIQLTSAALEALEAPSSLGPGAPPQLRGWQEAASRHVQSSLLESLQTHPSFLRGPMLWAPPLLNPIQLEIRLRLSEELSKWALHLLDPSLGRESGKSLIPNRPMIADLDESINDKSTALGSWFSSEQIEASWFRVLCHEHIVGLRPWAQSCRAGDEDPIQHLRNFQNQCFGLAYCHFAIEHSRRVHIQSLDRGTGTKLVRLRRHKENYAMALAIARVSCHGILYILHC